MTETEPSPRTILLVDDHALLRQGLRLLIGQEPRLRVVAEAADGVRALRLAAQWQPDVALIDLGLPDQDGVTVIACLASVAPRTRAIALTASLDPRDVDQAMAAGARAYVVKHGDGEALLAIILAVLADARDIRPEPSLINRPADPEPQSPLTRRELEIVRLIAGGSANAEIADHLAISVLTVRTHRQHLMEKLGLHNAAEITAYAIGRGLFAAR